jgi:hypothetical protein
MNWQDILVAHGLSIVTTIVAGAMAWQKMKDRHDEHQRRISSIEEKSECYDELSTRLAVITNELQWIKRELERRINGHPGDGRRDDRGGKGNPKDD